MQVCLSWQSFLSSSVPRFCTILLTLCWCCRLPTYFLLSLMHRWMFSDAYNTWTNNAASGGFAGFSFPHAPRPIKEHRRQNKTTGSFAGYPFDPSQRPFILFKNNTVHSTGYFWEHSGGIYFGGMIFYKTDPSDGQIKVSRRLIAASGFMSCIICFWYWVSGPRCCQIVRSNTVPLDCA